MKRMIGFTANNLIAIDDGEQIPMVEAVFVVGEPSYQKLLNDDIAKGLQLETVRVGLTEECIERLIDNANTWLKSVREMKCSIVPCRSGSEKNEEKTHDSDLSIPEMEENPEGLHRRYTVTKNNGEAVDPNAIYFVLRLDNGGRDKTHIRACREAAKAYVFSIYKQNPPAMVQVAEDLERLLVKLEIESATDG